MHRELSSLHQVNLVSQLRLFDCIGSEDIHPLVSRFRSTYAYSGSEVLADTIGN